MCLWGDDDDDEHGWSAIDDYEDGERQRDIERNNKHEGVFDAGGFFWRPAPEQRAHQDFEIEPRDMDQVAFVEVSRPRSQARRMPPRSRT